MDNNGIGLGRFSEIQGLGMKQGNFGVAWREMVDDFLVISQGGGSKQVLVFFSFSFTVYTMSL